MCADLFEERKDAPAEVERRRNAVHIYGVDMLSTKDLLMYFADYGPKYVEWLNDSSANVVFGDEGTAKRAIAGLGVPMSTEDLPEGAVNDASAIEFLWHKGNDFHKAGSDIPLVFRIATVLDVKPNEKVPSRRLWVGLVGEEAIRRIFAIETEEEDDMLPEAREGSRRSMVIPEDQRHTCMMIRWIMILHLNPLAMVTLKGGDM